MKIPGDNGDRQRLLTELDTTFVVEAAAGTGKTTVARLLADATELQFEQISAVFSGVADLKKVFDAARARREMGKGTLLFVDEVHRFNRAQQDSFLSVMEDGTVYSHSGKLLFSDLAVDPATGTVALRAEIPNPDGFLLPGMFVRVRVQQAVAEQGITVNAVCPGYVLTPLVQQQIPDTAKARGISEEQVVRDVLLAAQPTKQFVTVEQVAAFTAFLCSDDAAAITGAVLPIEGGWTAQ